MNTNKKKILGLSVVIVAILCVIIYINRPPLGQVEKITTAQLEEKMQAKESFAVVLTQVTCPHCKTFLEMMDSYLKDHKMVMYDVVLDLEPNREQALTELETIFPEFVGTPDIYYIEDGEVKSNLNRELEKGEGLDAKTFGAWAEKNNILDKE